MTQANHIHIEARTDGDFIHVAARRNLAEEFVPSVSIQMYSGGYSTTIAVSYEGCTECLRRLQEAVSAGLACRIAEDEERACEERSGAVA